VEYNNPDYTPMLFDGFLLNIIRSIGFKTGTEEVWFEPAAKKDTMVSSKKGRFSYNCPNRFFY
jgi:hypothetical protein